MAVLAIVLQKLRPSATELNGATLGESHANEMREKIILAHSEHQVVLDFDGIESASASYLKRILNPFFVPLSDPESFRREVFPIASNIKSSDLREDIETYLSSSERVLLIGVEAVGGIQFLDMLGRLDGAAAETFSELCNLKQVTALQLYQRYAHRTTNQTAWNNRLAKLVEMRIARRHREGRIWQYQPSLTK